MNRLFNIKMTWPKVIIFAIASAVVTALLNCIPALEKTSFTAPAETVELWILLAIIVIMNCSSYVEAALKTFVFFLISQPLIYLIEVPFKAAGWGLFRYYPYWAILTLLTIPGALIAYRVKKDDVLSAVILSAANVAMIAFGATRLRTLIYSFPHQLIAVIFCFVCPVLLTIYLIKNKTGRILAFVIAAAALAVTIYMYVISPSASTTSYYLEEGNWTVEYVSDDSLEASIANDDLVLKSNKAGDYVVILISDEGRKLSYNISVDGGTGLISVDGPTDITSLG